MAPTKDITDRAFTGQRKNMDWGLYYYNARYYVPALRRFASADTIVPEPSDPQSFNRYSYTLNNPLKYTDSSGHAVECSATGEDCAGGDAYSRPIYLEWPPETVSTVASQPANGLTLANASQSLTLATETYIGGTRLMAGTSYASQIIVYGSFSANEAAGISPYLRHARSSHPQLYRYTSAPGAFRSTLWSRVSGVTAVATVAGNAIDYSWGANSGHGIVSTEFAAANTVDLTTGLGLPALGAAMGTGCGAASPVCVPAFAGVGSVVDVICKTFKPETRQAFIDTLNSGYEWFLSPEWTELHTESSRWQAAYGMP